MNADHERLKAVLAEAAAQANPAERAVYLDDACRGDPEFRARVEALLRAHDRAGGFLEEPVVTTPPKNQVVSPGLTEKPGDWIGRYKLLQQIGEGGCGVVYMAEQVEPVRRRVALKIIKLGMDTRSVIARFEAERQALALMDHPNIAKVFDAGATETGRPFFVMELVRGIRITDYCDQNHLSMGARLHLFIQVCHALQHAHQKGIIHRDIKPSNILVTLHDGVPMPVVIDFGIAKATALQPLTDKTLFTAFEQFIGTPAYMSPEQAELSRLDIDTRSDIYALGVLLYELLTGKTPFDTKTLLAAGLDEMRRIIREQEPVRPSTRITQEMNNSQSQIQNPKSKIEQDLDWIVMKCLEKDRTRRYETANGLALDVERHLNHEPVVARPPSAAYRIEKFVRRNRLLVSAGVAVATALVLGVVVSSWQALVARNERDKTRVALQEAEVAREHAQSAQTREVQLRQLTEALRFEAIAEDRALKEEYGDNTTALAHAIASLERGDTWARRRLALIALWKGPTRFRLSRADEFEPGGYVSVSPDGQWLATGSRRPQVLLWPSDGGDPKVLPVPDATRVFGATYSPGGRWLLSAHKTNGSLMGPYHGVLWDGQSLEPRAVWHSAEWAPYWFHPDESRLLAYSLIWNTTHYPGVAWWPVDGTAVTPLGSPRAEPPLQLRFPPDRMFTFYPSKDLRWLVSWEGTNVYVSGIEESALGPRRLIGNHERPILAASLDAHGDWVSSADMVTMRIWSRTGPGRPLLRAPATAMPAIFDRLPGRVFACWPDPNRFAVSYDLRGPIGAKPLTYFPAQMYPDDPWSLLDGHWIVMGSCLTFGQRRERDVFLYPVRALWPFHVDLGLEPSFEPRGGRLAPDGRRVVVEQGQRLLLVDLHSPDLSRHVVFESPERRWIWNWKFDRSGGHLLVGTLNSGAWRVSLDQGVATQLEGTPRDSAAVAFSPSGNRIAVGSGLQIPPEERCAQVLDREGRFLARLDLGGGENVHDLEFLTETEIILAGPKGLRWWNTESNELRLLRQGAHGQVVVSEQHILSHTASDVWLYDRATLTGHTLDSMDASMISKLAIAPDESFVVAGYAGGALRVRHLAEDHPHYLPGAKDWALPAVADWVSNLWIDPRGYWIAAITGKGHLSYWPVPRGRPLHDRPLDEFLDLLRAQTNIRVVTDPDAPEGYREISTEFPGWDTVPGWQEWYSEEFMAHPPWKPMLDPATIPPANP